LTDVSLKLYENARHEILNETNKDEVVEDILGWLNKKSALHS
jgi:alpha-beta hydrolase superfamily lysophospholipase